MPAIRVRGLFPSAILGWRQIAALAIGLIVLTASLPTAHAQLIYEFEESFTGDILATLELAQLPATVEGGDLISLNFTPAGDALFGFGETYLGAFDLTDGDPLAGVFDDGMAGLGCGGSAGCSSSFNDFILPPVSSLHGTAGVVAIQFSDGDGADVLLSGFSSTLVAQFGDWRLPPIDPPDPPDEVYWTGASISDNRDYNDPTNWIDTSTSLPPLAPPAATTTVIWDNRIDPGAAIENFAVLVDFDDSQVHQASSLTVTSGYDAGVLSNGMPPPPGPAELEVLGPLEIRDGGGLDITGGLTLDLRPGGAEGDVTIRSSTSLTSLFLVGGDLYADEVIVESGPDSILSVSSSDSKIEARRMELQQGSENLIAGVALISEEVSLDGELNLFGAILSTPAVTVSGSGYLLGNNAHRTTPLVTGDVSSSGRLRPGNDAGLLIFRHGLFTIDGNYSQTKAGPTATGTLEIDLNSTTPASTDDPLQELAHDVLSVTGLVSLEGDLVVQIGPDLVLEPGMEFVFLEAGLNRTGTFDGLPEGAVALTDPLTGLDLLISYDAGDGNDVSLLAVSSLNGDYNNDGVVDAADYTVWRDNLGAPAGTLLNDNDGGVIGSAQYNTWAANFGNQLANAIAIPEPATLGLLIGGVLLLRNPRQRAGVA